MTRVTDAMFQKPPFYAVGMPTNGQVNTPMIDPKYGGQFGHMMDYDTLSSSSPYVRQHMVCVLIKPPTGFSYFPEPKVWTRTLKAILEEQSKEISGLISTLKIDNIDQTVGGAGEIVSAVSNVTREVSSPSHSIYEKYNMPISAFVNTWILELMMDPETKYPIIITREGVKIKDHKVDFYGATVLYFEPDPTFQFPLKAWLCYFVRPNSEGPTMEGSRNLTSGKEELTVELRMSATTQVGAGVNELALKIMQTMKVTNNNPFQRPAAFTGVDSSVSAERDTGYKEGMDDASAVALKLS